MARRTANSTDPSRARTLLRVAGLALALAFLLAQSASRLHLVEVAHRACAEHGALEHGTEGYGSNAAQHHGAPARAAPDDAPAAPAETHEACELAELLNAAPDEVLAAALVPSAVPPAVRPATVIDEVRPREVRGRRESARGPPRAA